MTQQEKQSLLNQQYLIVNNAEAELKATDYIAAKIAEGKATKTEYKEKIHCFIKFELIRDYSRLQKTAKLQNNQAISPLQI